MAKTHLTTAQVANHLANFDQSLSSIDQVIGKLHACVLAARSNPNTTAAQWTKLRRQYELVKDAVGPEVA
jgi:hypothetical protein